MAHTPITSQTAPEHQVPQWLFAFDPAGITTFRSLALLASHPDYASQARKEINSQVGSTPPSMLWATVLESLRLWPTTPLSLRESTAETSWKTGIMPANTGIVIFTPFFHRDSERLSYADRFAPEQWMSEQMPENWPLVPFSEGPAVCPGRHLVLLLSTAMLSALMKDGQLRWKPTMRLRSGQPVPATLNHYGLRFEFKD
jgi:cytochrome P450